MNRQITDSPATKDGYENLSAAYNLAYHGVISVRNLALGQESDLSPTDYREPLPIIFLAAYIKLIPGLSSSLTADTINEGSALIAVKLHNLIWASSCLLGVALAILLSIRSPLVGTVVSVIALALTYKYYFDRWDIVDSTYTELQASTLLVWSSIMLIIALKTGRPIWFIATGILVGALALTKALFLYVGLGLIITLLLIYLVRPPEWGRWGTVSRVGLIAISLMAVTIPWMVRNFIYFHTFEITQRNGMALLIRAYNNQMSDDEYRGAFYVYAPPFLQDWIGEWLGFKPEDLEKGGRLQRLNEKSRWPEEAFSFYRSAQAEWMRLQIYYRDEGATDPSHLAERASRREAKQLILSNPLRHLKMSVVFMWRGMWAMRANRNLMTVCVNALAFLSIGVMALLGLVRRDAVLIGIALLPVGAIIFLALFSDFIPRYMSITIPNMVIALSISTTWIASWLGAQIGQNFNFQSLQITSSNNSTKKGIKFNA
jgi:hypothetical protein